MKRAKGLFIVFEGPDKSGKSTQARLLADTLRGRGHEMLHTREPGGTSVAEGVRKVLLDPALSIDPLAELFLYEASRAQHTSEKIRPALEAGKIVISERFTMPPTPTKAPPAASGSRRPRRSTGSRRAA